MGSVDMRNYSLESPFGVTQYGPVQSRSWSIPLHDVKHPIMDHPNIQTAGWVGGCAVPVVRT